MKYRPGRVHVASLVALAVVGLVLAWLAENTKSPEQRPFYEQKMTAAERTQDAMSEIRTARLALRGEIDLEVDRNMTGLVGAVEGGVTTSRGWYEQKLRALDPNIAAVFVQLLRRGGVGEGDRVAVGMTGAFPVLNAATLIAIETVGATPVAITSVGASQWGANDAELTWLDMETILEDAGIIRRRSVAASRGGRGDRARGDEIAQAVIDSAIARNGVAPIVPSSLDESIDLRMEIYDDRARGGEYDLYVNVGSGLGSIGTIQMRDQLGPGLTRRPNLGNLSRRGAMVRMADRGVPVIDVPSADWFIDRYGLAGLADENATLPAVGHGDIFERDRYSVPLAGILAVLYGFLIFVVVRIDIKHYLFRKAR